MIKWAYYMRYYDNMKDNPNYYTIQFLKHIADPIYKSIILSNRWDRESKRMVVDTSQQFKLIVGGANELVFNYFQAAGDGSKQVTKPFVTHR